MLKTYLKTAFRSLFKNKFFTIINVSGLSVGIAVSMLMLIYVVHELSFENFQKNKKSIFRIALEWGNETSNMKFAGSMPALAPAINENVPEVKEAVRIRKDWDAVVKKKDQEEFNEDGFFIADPGVFDIFSFHLIEGDPHNVLADPFAMVISEKTALKYFGSTDPVGQVLYYNDYPVNITGVMENVPENTHLHCDILLSYSTLKAMGEAAEQPWNQWGDDMTYIQLQDNSKVASIVPKLDEMLKKNAGEWLSSRIKFTLQPLKEIHWDNQLRGDIGKKGNKAYLYIFLSAAIFVLIIACFNFMNLSISKYFDRMKEVGVRKVSGAGKHQVITQFMTESVMVVLISLGMGLLLFSLFYPNLYAFLNTDFIFNSFFITACLVISLGFVVIVGGIAGGYPAMSISNIKPIDILHHKIAWNREKIPFRKILIMLQFAISIILIVGTSVIFRQVNFMKNSDLGFDKKNVVLLYFPGMDKRYGQKYEVLRDELLKNPGVTGVSGIYSAPGVNSQMNLAITPEGVSTDNSVNIQALPADFGFVKTLGLKIVEGRDFSRDYPTDKNGSVLLNQEAVSFLGLKNPIGTRLRIPGEAFKEGVKVIGVVRDFHLRSFHNKIDPMMIYINPEVYINVAVRMNTEEQKTTLAQIKKTWTGILPSVPFSYNYLEDTYNALYQSEDKTGKMLSLFTTIALFISCLGLFGFASYVVSKRNKEVGIRKVLGANTAGISWMLSGQFTLWVVISGIIASPVAYLLVRKWLMNFAFRITISWWIFLVAIVFTLIIAVATVSWQSWRAATRNPVEALRYE